MKPRAAALRIAFTAALLGSASLAHAELKGPVKTRQGLVSGAPSTRADGVMVYKGIPFAAAPVGALRFKDAQPPQPWQGVRDGTKWGNTCIQPSGKTRPIGVNQAVDMPDSPPMSEDCLNLNVWTPEPGRGARLPVLVWLHGGALTRGSSAVPVYDGHAFARDGVVFVSVNYRLGVEGYGLFPDTPPNPGLRDQLAALRWVHDTVAGFGGDPDRITLCGQSAGAISAGALLAAPQAQGSHDPVVYPQGCGMWITKNPDAAKTKAENADDARPSPKTRPAQYAPRPPQSVWRTRLAT